uniref:cAMP-independent regulatory protein pac2 n=1 Tax=Bionectria ochroleuca TaxID=29856 RepID=A0A8H7NJD9_BIOOC
METYFGYVRTPADAIKLFEACRLGLLPRVQRRLSEKERQSIRSGSVFVWDEREAGMRRWTDGKSWSASRVSGSFLTYREMEGKRGGGGFNSIRRGSNKTPESGRGSDDDRDDGEPEGYRYKADGLMKQSFSITTSNGQHLHLISYYSRPQHGQADLPQPTNDPALRSIVPMKGMYPESSMGEASQTPALTRAPMQQPPYMVPTPQHHAPHQAYPPQYGQPGYGWPPSPAQTPLIRTTPQHTNNTHPRDMLPRHLNNTPHTNLELLSPFPHLKSQGTHPTSTIRLNTACPRRPVSMILAIKISRQLLKL